MIELVDSSERIRALTDLGSTLLVEAAAGTGKTALMAGRVTNAAGQFRRSGQHRRNHFH